MSQKSSKKLNLQQKLDAFSELIAWFEQPDFDIEAALEKFKQADSLAKDIEKHLNVVGNEIKILKKSFEDGKNQ